MTGASSLPPLKTNEGKYGVLALLLLLAAGGLWFFLGGDDSEQPTEAAPVEQEPADREPTEEVTAEIEIPPDLEPSPETEPRDAQSATKPSSESSGASPEDWVCTGAISPAQARAVIQGAASKQVQTCYERGLKTNNLLQGSMEVELTIDRGGVVKGVSIGGNLNDRQVQSCVRRVAKTWKFPQPTGGCVRINVPFQLTPKL